MNAFVVLVLSVCVVLFILANLTLVITIHISDALQLGFNIERNISGLRLLFITSPVLCIASGSEEILDDLLELFRYDYKPVTLYDFTKSLLTCDGVYILETTNHTVLDCEGILDSYQTSVVYVTKDSITADLSRSLEACLSVTQSPEVLALSLSDSSLLQLSPVFPQPRHFVSTSVTEVLQRRGEKSKKLDLQGSPLNIGTLYYIPFFIYEESESSNKEEYDGIYIQVVEEMARQFNFTCTYLLYKHYGRAFGNGTWRDGLAQVIQEGKVHIVATNMWQVPEMYKLVDFGPTFNKGQLAFLVFRPEVIDFQWQAILRIFKPKVWFGILGSFVLTVVVYWAGVNWDPRPCTESWSGCILTIFGYFTSSSTHSRVDEGNTRFALTSWAVFSLLITTSLSTGIVTRLTIPFYSPRIDTVKQLVEGKYVWTLQFYDRFRNNTHLKETLFDLKNHWIRLFEEKYVYMDEDEVARTAGTDKRVAYVVQTYGSDFVVLETDGLDSHKNLKYYRVSKEAFTEAHVTFGVKKHSLLLEPLTYFALSISQAGLMARWRDEVIRRWPQYDTRQLLIEQDILTFSEPQGLPLYKVQPVFALLLFGLSLAFFVFFIEICW